MLDFIRNQLTERTAVALASSKSGQKFGRSRIWPNLGKWPNFGLAEAEAEIRCSPTIWKFGLPNRLHSCLTT